MPAGRSFKGRKFPLSRSEYGQKVRDAKADKLNRLRDDETVALRQPKAFEAVVNMIKPPKPPKEKRNGY